MFVYEKKLQYPVCIKTPNPKMAAVIISQYGGPDGELGASLRYLSQRFSMPYKELKGLLTDIGTEEPVMLLHQDFTEDKPFFGLLIHTIRTSEELARYSKKNQFDKDVTPKKKTSRQEKIIRIFA